MGGILKINAFETESQAAALLPETLRVLRRRERAFGPGSLLFYSNPVHVVRASGVWLYDPQGNAYLDAYNNVPHVGHCHPHVIEAVTRQIKTLNIHTRYLADAVYDYTDALLDLFPPGLSNVVLTCTGTEAVDLAMQVAKSVTGRTGFIVTRFAYHGNNAAASSISPALGRSVPIGCDVRLADAPDGYRNPDVEIADYFADSVERAIDDLQRHGTRLAGMIVDSSFSSDGVFSDPPGFLAKAVERVRSAGGLYIADEVQPGFGRTGTEMWGFERHGVTPDLVVMGKAMGNGLPIGAVVARPDTLDCYVKDIGYFNTFGGNPVCCAAALAVLEVIEREDLMSNARDVGRYLKDGIKGLSGRHEQIGDVRGCGFIIGMDVVNDRTSKVPDTIEARRIMDGMRERRVLTSAAGEAGNILKIRPPMPFSRENANQFLEVLDEVLSSRRD